MSCTALSLVSGVAAAVVALAFPAPSLAQGPAPAGAAAAPTEDDTLRFRMPTVTVTAQKQPEDRQAVPVSVTAVTRGVIDAAGIRVVGDAASFAPNTVFTEATARKLSNPRFRGIGSSPGNPAITTFIDGVPQLNAASSSLELLDVDQIELVRGPQSALFGRNTLGGLVNVTSSRPSTTGWTGSLTLPIASHGGWGVRGGVSGPVIADRLAVGLSVAQVSRDGFTVNDVTGRDIDGRSALSLKGQVVFTPDQHWETRVIVSGERARDGDYGLHDVAALRANPYHAARDFAGATDRDLVATTIHVRRTGGPLVFSSTTGLVSWTTRDLTDLDYSPQPLITRDNAEEDLQFTQELRVASSGPAPVAITEDLGLRWQAGAFFFTQGYEQDAINSYAPGLVAPFPVSQHSPRAALDDHGVGLFGQATVTLRQRLDLSAGLRVDHESKKASLETVFDPQLAPPARVAAEQRFSNVSPQIAAAFRPRPDYTVYATVGRGFKAGGFNAASPAGREAYGEELAWHVEGGVKTRLAGGRVTANAAVFHIDWNDLQLNVPDPAVPAQFFIANIGGATSRGVELEVAARAAPGADLFAAIGYTHARFGAGAVSGSIALDGNELPYTPGHTISVGGQYARPVRGGTALGRVEIARTGRFHYDDANALGQDAYTLVNLRAAYTARRWIAELFVRNAFDARYIPFAIPYPGLAPSGFLGEMGAPRRVGASIGLRF